MTHAPAVLADEFWLAIHAAFWNRGAARPLTLREYRYWGGRYQPIEDEE